MATGEAIHPAFMHSRYLFRKKFFKIFGGAFHVYDTRGNVVLFSKQKAFKLREDFRIYSDASMSEELITIKTPQILDLGATYYVVDSKSGQSIGALRRKFLKSMIKDEWMVLGPDGAELGRLTEHNIIAALLSRFISLVPQLYVVLTADGRQAAKIKQHFNPFILKYTMTIDDEAAGIDRRLLIGAGILLAAIEGRQG